MVATVYIDGEAGTTGMQVRARLREREDVHLLSLEPGLRHDVDARRAMLNAADVVVLCLPDAAARESAHLIENPNVRVVDASSAHRITPDWVYGLPELTSAQTDVIRHARLVANPGCFATGAILLLRPLVEAGLLPVDHPISIAGIGGYTVGGRRMVERRKAGEDIAPVAMVGLDLNHRHVPEIKHHAGLMLDPLFMPSVGGFPQGMMVQIPLHRSTLTNSPSSAEIRSCLAGRYANSECVRVASAGEDGSIRALDASGMAGSDGLDIHVFANDDTGQFVLVSCFDNLGKGAAGSAVRNIGLMLGDH